ncbi:HNH endonuclease [Pseudoalteromonas piscicida]|uniref:HNH endonuclease n=1 Tax=Pseudoalteromonas piscicida TaxID=43662 RepID=UPI0032BF8594
MFNLNYRDYPKIEKMHQEWCKTNSPLPEQNPDAENEFFNWLYSVKDELYTCSPEQMLDSLTSLIQVFNQSVMRNQELFHTLCGYRFLFWERYKNNNTNILFCVFEWPQTPEFLRIRELCRGRANAANNANLENSLRELNILEQVSDAVEDGPGRLLISKFKKYFPPDSLIKLPLRKFVDNDDFDVFEAFCSNNFDYKKFSRQRGDWGPYPLIELLENTVCPYCNRSYTHSVFEGDVYGGRPELDHFLSKSVFPFFALSIYNLIPVCHSCNHAKLDKHVVKILDNTAAYTHLHPNILTDNVQDIQLFTTEHEGDLLSFLVNNDFSLNGKIQITEDCRARTKVMNSMEIYNLAFDNSERKLVGYYRDHYKDIERTLNLVKRYPVSAINSIANLLKEDEKSLRRVFVENLISESPGDEPLGKLKNDLLSSIIFSLDD